MHSINSVFSNSVSRKWFCHLQFLTIIQCDTTWMQQSALTVGLNMLLYTINERTCSLVCLSWDSWKAFRYVKSSSLFSKGFSPRLLNRQVFMIWRWFSDVPHTRLVWSICCRQNRVGFSVWLVKETETANNYLIKSCSSMP